MAISKKILLITCLVVLVLIGGIVTYIVLANKNQTQSSSSETAQLISAVDQMETGQLKDASALKVEQIYAGKVKEYESHLVDRQPSSWQKKDLDEVYFLIVYYKKQVNALSVYKLLTQLTSAQEGGVNINNNSLGKAEDFRKNMLDWALEDQQVQRFRMPDTTKSQEKG